MRSVESWLGLIRTMEEVAKERRELYPVIHSESVDFNTIKEKSPKAYDLYSITERKMPLEDFFRMFKIEVEFLGSADEILSVVACDKENQRVHWVKNKTYHKASRLIAEKGFELVEDRLLKEINDAEQQTTKQQELRMTIEITQNQRDLSTEYKIIVTARDKMIAPLSQFDLALLSEPAGENTPIADILLKLETIARKLEENKPNNRS